MFVENIHAPFGQANDIWKNSSEGEAIFELYLQCVEDCAAYEIPTMVIHASCGPQKIPPINGLGLDRFKRIAEKAQRSDINIAVENMCRPEAIATATYILEQIDSPRLGFCFDAGHHNARQAPEMDMLARFGHRLMALHLHDNDGTDDQHLLPFDGTVDWPALMRKIAQSGYKGPTTLEVVCEGYQDISPEHFLALAYKQAVRLDQLRMEALS